MMDGDGWFVDCRGEKRGWVLRIGIGLKLEVKCSGLKWFVGG